MAGRSALSAAPSKLETQPKPPNWIQRLFGLTNEKWDDIKPHHWAFVESVLQSHTKEFKLRLKQKDETKAKALLGELRDDATASQALRERAAELLSALGEPAAK